MATTGTPGWFLCCLRPAVDHFQGGRDEQPEVVVQVGTNKMGRIAPAMSIKACVSEVAHPSARFVFFHFMALQFPNLLQLIYASYLCGLLCLEPNCLQSCI